MYYEIKCVYYLCMYVHCLCGYVWVCVAGFVFVFMSRFVDVVWGLSLQPLNCIILIGGSNMQGHISNHMKWAAVHLSST